MSFSLTSRQTEVLENFLVKYTYFLIFGGSRSGKTFLIVRSICIRAFKKKSNHLIYRFRFNAVKNSIGRGTFVDVMQTCFPGVPYTIDKTDWFITFPNGSRIWLAGSDEKERIDKMLGYEFSTIYCNEATQTEYDTFNVIKTRLCEKSGLRLRFWLDCNPTSQKFWLYQVFVQQTCPQGGVIDKYQYGQTTMMPEDNQENLPASYLKELDALPKKMRDRFKLGVFSTDTEGALWSMDDIEKCRTQYKTIKELFENEEVISIGIGIDPAVSTQKNSDNTGIILACVAQDGTKYILDDLTCKKSPNAWANIAINTYNEYNCNLIVVEVNQGGDLVENLLRANGYNGLVKNVRASKGKHARAEPIVNQYEMGKVKHLNSPRLNYLEDEMLSYIPLESSKSPDRLDAMVWIIDYFSDDPNSNFFAHSC